MTISNLDTSLALWQTRVLRLTAFASTNGMLPIDQWWTQLVKVLPDKESSQPKERKIRWEGRLDERAGLILESQPGRIDWGYLPGEQEEESSTVTPEVTIPLAGSFPEALERFLPLMTNWLSLDSCPPVTRLAFGALLLQPAPDLTSVYRLLATYLPFLETSPESLTDFVYHINRRRPSRSGPQGLIINRLTKWGVGIVQEQRLGFGPQGLRSTDYGPESYFARLELDINTLQEHTDAFEYPMLPQIFHELVDLGKEIAQKGDIP